jgi:hypothetical protein
MKKLYAIALSLFISYSGVAQTPTWSGQIANIVYEHCTPCHHPGGLAPSSFVTYQEAFVNRFGISYAVTNKLMPPWPNDPNYMRHAHDNVLSASEITALQQWAANGGPSGNMQVAPAPPVYNDSTKLGTVDLALQMQPYVITQNGDVYRNFVLPTGLTQTRYATAIEVIPGNSEIVHHVLVFMDTTNNTIDPNSPGGTGSAASTLIYGYVPGAEPYFAPPGTGFRFPPNTRIIIQVHYGPGSNTQTDATKVNFKLTATPQREIIVLPVLSHVNLTNGPLSIPANTTKTFFQQRTIQGNWTALYAWPHMHLIGRNITTFANKPNGDTIRFVDIPKWDFHWQMNYVFRNTVYIPNGSVMRARAFYDNTVNNPYNPSNPPQNVTAGEGTNDEMMLVFFAILPHQNGDENLIVDKRIIPISGTNICNGQSVLLKTIEGNGYTYQWKRNGTNISGATGAYYSATQAGNYTVAITLGPNTVTSDAVSVTVNASPSANITPAGSTAICPGGSALLQASTGSNYTYRWFRNDTLITNATSATFTAQQTGNYTVEVFNGCYATSAPVSITTGSASATISANGSTAICNNNSVTLTASSSNAYSWSNNATTQSITVSQPGNYTVTVTQAGCTATASQSVTVSPLPTSFFTHHANGNTVTFTNASADASSYEWDFGDGTTATTQNATHTYTQTGTYIVTLTATNACGSTTHTTTVNLSCSPISVLITANGTTSFCEGNTVVLSNISAQQLTYQWLNNGQAITNANSSSLTVSAPGNYSLQITDASNCPGSSNDIQVTVFATPAAPVIIASGSVLESSVADNYEWFLDGNTLGNNTPQHFPTANGCYQVKITDNNGCSAVSDTVCIQLSITDVVNISTADITLYPNPVTDLLFIGTGGKFVNGFIQCLDVTGKLLITAPLNENQNFIDISNINNGLYFITITDLYGHILTTKKIVKQSH